MVVEELGARGSGLGKCEGLILHERDFCSFSQIVSGVVVGEIGFGVSRSCHEGVRGWGGTCGAGKGQLPR